MNNTLKNLTGVLLLCAALGPYLIAGLRLDHVVVLLLGTFCILFAVMMRTTMPERLVVLTITLLAGALVTMISDYVVAPHYREASYMSGIGRLLFPVLIISISAFVISKRDFLDDSRAKYFFSVIVWVAALSGFITVLSVFVDLTWIENMYSVGDDGGVWAQSNSIGRHTGLFNQPLEAGVFYSTALFVAIFIRYSEIRVSWNTTVVIFFIVAGGAMSLSKNFVIVAVVLSLYFLYALNRRTFFRLIIFILFLLIVIGVGVYNYADSSLSFLESLYALYERDGLLAALTAGRYGSHSGAESDVEEMYRLFLTQAPLTGFGVNTRLPLDSGYLEYGYQGGVFALLSNILFFVTLLIYSIKAVGNYSKLLFVLAVYGIIASLGGPVITANRANISYIFCICVCLYYSYPRRYISSKKR